MSDAEGAGELPDREPTDAEKIMELDWQNYMDARPHTGMREAAGDDDAIDLLKAILDDQKSIVDDLEGLLEARTSDSAA